MSSIPRFVLTGGPCSGKSSAKAVLQQRLPQLGIRPIFIPETATTVFTSGIDASSVLSTKDSVDRLQSIILKQQLSTEDVFSNLALLQQELTDDKVILICDRAALDSSAYVEDEVFQSLLQKSNLSREQLIARYDAVFHLVSAADGASQFYNFDNPARYETREEAILVDKRLQAAWSGHPHFRIIPNLDRQGNQISFDQKLDWLVTEVCHTIGIPSPLEIERKFLLSSVPAIPLPTTAIRVHQTYLVGQENSRRVRRWQYAGSSSSDTLFFYTEKTGTGAQRIEHEKRITVSQYLDLVEQRIPGSFDIVKTRHCFSWNNQYFELDIFESPVSLVVLEIELTEESDVVILPPFIQDALDVTDDPRYTNASIATGSLS